jgi:hypothetical protein
MSGAPHDSPHGDSGNTESRARYERERRTDVARRTYVRTYQAAWVQRRRAEWLAANGPCVQCGSADQLEVDHIDRGEKLSHRIWSWTPARRDAELAKCQVLCAECHREKTAAENRREIPHGTRSCYVHRRCRCESCRRANADALRRQREALRVGAA